MHKKTRGQRSERTTRYVGSGIDSCSDNSNGNKVTVATGTAVTAAAAVTVVAAIQLKAAAEKAAVAVNAALDSISLDS